MRRYRALCIVSIMVAGCAPERPVEPHLASRPCAALARLRQQDARANGDDDRMQLVIFKGTYADCVAWEAKGHEPNIP
jgi:hypothetical protein